jgi:hypothetical protein
MKTLDIAVILAFVAVDDLRNALMAVLINSDVFVLVAALIIVYFISKNQGALTHAVTPSPSTLLGGLGLGEFTAPLKKLKLM